MNPHGYTLNYNEFIVYDVKQIKMKYLVKVKFNFKWFVKSFQTGEFTSFKMEIPEKFVAESFQTEDYCVWHCDR